MDLQSVLAPCCVHALIINIVERDQFAPELTNESLRPVVHIFKVEICYFKHLADGSRRPHQAGVWKGGVGNSNDLFIACARLDRGEGRFRVSMVTRVPAPYRQVAREREVMSFIKGNLLTENSEVGYKRPRPVIIRYSLISSTLRNEVANAMGMCSCLWWRVKRA